jgi:hypothetical protein
MRKRACWSFRLSLGKECSPMRAISAVVMAGLLALSGPALARPPQTAAKHATTSRSVEVPPLTRLPQWAVPEYYDLAI